MQDSEYEKAAALAMNAETSADTLRHIAGTHPDLRALVALHPNTPPDLMARLAQESNPAVQAAVRSRLQPGATEQRPSATDYPQGISASAGPKQPAKQRSRSRRLLLIPLVIVLVVGIGAGAWFLLKPQNRPLFPAELSEGVNVAGQLLAMSPDGLAAAIRREDTVVGVDTGTGRELWSKPTPEDADCRSITTGIGCSNWESDAEIATGEALSGGLHRGEMHGGSGITLVQNIENNMRYEAYRGGEVIWQTPDDWANYSVQTTDKYVLFYGSYYFSPPKHIVPQVVLADIETGETLATVPLNVGEREIALLVADGFMVSRTAGESAWDMVGYNSDGLEKWRMSGFTMPISGMEHHYHSELKMPILEVLQEQLATSQDLLNSKDPESARLWSVVYANPDGIYFSSGGGDSVGAGLQGDRRLGDWTGDDDFFVSQYFDGSKCGEQTGKFGGWENCPPEAYGPYVVRDTAQGKDVQELDLPREGELSLVGFTLAHQVDDRVTFWNLEAA